MSEPTLTYPRLLYRGPEDDSAETQAFPDAEAGELALKAGWRAHRRIVKPAKPVTPVVPSSVPSILDGSVADLTAAIMEQADPRTLQNLRLEETRGKNRKGALDAIDARLAELNA